MSAGSSDPVPDRGLEGWTSSLRLLASTQLRSRLEQVTTRRDVARVGSEYFRDMLNARSVSITTLGDGRYKELVNVGTLPPPSSWYPKETVYPETVYPLTTQKLKAGGYFTASLDHLDYVELVGSRDDPEVQSVMGVPIVSGGQLRGEMFMARGYEQEPFDQEDLDASRDLAGVLGDSLQAAAGRAEVQAEKARRGIRSSGQ